jgi:solute:Na+ symporter, SSS family
MGFDVSNEAANAVLYSVLSFFTLLAVIAGGYLSKYIPERYTNCCLLKQQRVTTDNDDTNNTTTSATTDDPTTTKPIMTTDYFLSARNSANAREIALSFFASGMGAWVRLSYLLLFFIHY